MFKLEIETVNAAFDESRKEAIAHMLREIAATIEVTAKESFRAPIRDFNGNTVGFFSLEKGEE